MLNFELPATGRENAPAFLAAGECREWLIKVPLANPRQAQAMVQRQLELLHRFDMPVSERLAILEELRGSIARMQEDAAKTFATRPLPLAPQEQQALESTLAIWNFLALGYMRCFATAAECQGKEAAELQARLAQRTVSVFADWQVDLCRGEQLPDASYWQRLYKLLTAAESLGVVEQAVDDPVRHGKLPTSVAAAFGECCLLSTASLFELPARHLAWVARWARRWGGKLELLRAPPDDIRNRAQPLWVNAESDEAPGYVPRPTSGGRWLETTELRKSLTTRITLLEQGNAPAKLQLGDDVTQPAAGFLLRRALQRWCQGGTPRRETRRPAEGECGVMVGFDAIHRSLSGGKTFKAPSNDPMALRREREEFETFGDRRLRTDAATVHHSEAGMENWRVVDQWQLMNASAGGMRISRPLDKGARVGAGHLIATRTADSQRFMLAIVRWALREGLDTLVAGIQLLPGEPKPATVRVIEPGGGASIWRQGLLLPEIAALKIPASLVLQVGTFRLDRRIEVLVGQDMQVLKLSSIIDHGADFERCIARLPE